MWIDLRTICRRAAGSDGVSARAGAVGPAADTSTPAAIATASGQRPFGARPAVRRRARSSTCRTVTPRLVTLIPLFEGAVVGALTHDALRSRRARAWLHLRA